MTLIQKLRAAPLLRDDRGLTTVEYVILLAIIAAFSVGVWKSFGEDLKTRLENSSGAVIEATSLED